MQVTQISATIRMSRQQHDGSWATVELSAKGSISPGDIWTEEQRELYLLLKSQLTDHFQSAQQRRRAVDTDTGEIKDRAQTQPTPADPKCPDHQQAQASSKFQGFYCPARRDDGSWCRWSYRNGKETAPSGKGG